MRECRACKKTKPESDFQKTYYKDNPNKLRKDCRECKESQKKKWKANNKEHIRAYEASWRLNNPEMRKRSEAWKEFLVKAAIKKERLIQEKKAKLLAIAKERKSKYKVCRECKRKVLKSLFKPRKERAEGIEAICLMCLNARRRNKHKRPFYLSKFNNECFNCYSKEELSLDHNIPISKGGDVGEKNTVVLCMRCNSQKGRKMPVEFYNKDKLLKLKRLMITIS